MSIIEYRLQHFTAIILPLRLPLVRGFNRCQCFANIIICQVFQAMLRHPLVHHGAPWYAMSGEGLVIHLGQLTPPAESATENASSSRVQPCPAVQSMECATQPRKYSTSCHKFSRQIASMLNGAEPTWLGTKKLLMTVWLSQPQCGSNLPASSSCSSSKASATLVTPKRRRPRK